MRSKYMVTVADAHLQDFAGRLIRARVHRGEQLQVSWERNLHPTDRHIREPAMMTIIRVFDTRLRVFSRLY